MASSCSSRIRIDGRNHRDSVNTFTFLPSRPLPDLTGRIIGENGYPSAHGGFSDIWTGIWVRDSRNCKVAVKVIRTNHESDNAHEKMNKRLHKEIQVWQTLNHENILPLYGITFGFGRNNSMGMVCPWMENGTLNYYLERCGAILSLRDRFRILCNVAAGLSYIHLSGVVHGDLTGSNILIDGERKACLADFGLSNVLVEVHGSSYVTSSIGGSVRWAAPEHFRISRHDCISTVTTHGDISSFGSVILQTISGKLPYYHLRKDTEVLIELHQGLRPPRPIEVDDEHWALIRQCWADNPLDRPGITDVAEWVQKHYVTVSGDALKGSGNVQGARDQCCSSQPTSNEALRLEDSTVSYPSPLLMLICTVITTFLSYQVVP